MVARDSDQAGRPGPASEPDRRARASGRLTSRRPRRPWHLPRAARRLMAPPCPGQRPRAHVDTPIVGRRAGRAGIDTPNPRTTIHVSSLTHAFAIALIRDLAVQPPQDAFEASRTEKLRAIEALGIDPW